MTREDKRAYNYARDRLVNDDYPVYSDEYELELAYKAGIEDAKNHPHWISVREQLPPKEAMEDEFITDISIDVLATDGKTIHICFYDHNLERWLYGDFWQLDNITHWMPLPSVEHLKDK